VVPAGSTLAHVACDMVFTKLLFNTTLRTDGRTGTIDSSETNPWAAHAPPGAVAHMLTIAKNCVDQRWQLDHVRSELQGLLRTYDGDACIIEEWQATANAIVGAFVERRDASATRCLARYC
jgi:hypothetical protein